MTLPTYQRLTDLAEGVMQILKGIEKDGSPLFQSIGIVCAISEDQVLQMMTGIGALPAAIIVAGPGMLDRENHSRELVIGVVVIDDMGSALGAGVDKVLGALDLTLEAFGYAARMGNVQIDDTPIAYQSWRTLNLPTKYAAYLIELSASQYPNLTL